MKNFIICLKCAVILTILFSENAGLAQENTASYIPARFQKQFYSEVTDFSGYDETNSFKSTLADSTVTVLGKLNTGETCYALAVSGDYVYLATGFNLEIVNVKDPANPVLAGKVYIQGSSGTIDNIAVDGNYAYVSDMNSGLHIIDVSDPTAPVDIKVIPGTGGVSAYKADVVNDTAYVALGTYGLHIYNVSDPKSPMEIGSFDITQHNITDVSLEGKYALVADNSNGLLVLDVSDPAKPVAVGSYSVDLSTSLKEDCYRVYVDGKDAYILDPNHGIDILDLSDPTKPARASFIDNTTNDDIAFSSHLAYLASYQSRLGIFDVSDPTAPKELTSLDSGLKADFVVSDGANIYTMSGPELEILRNDLLTEVEEHQIRSNQDISLAQNYPNPVKMSTTIGYSIKKPGHVRLRVYDTFGHVVANPVNEMESPGNYKTKMNVGNLPAGVYIYRLEENGETVSKEMSIK